MLEKSKWIWIHNGERPDEYADFKFNFTATDPASTHLNIAVDGNFVAYLNGQLCAFGSCADYPFHKFYDTFPLSGQCRLGENELAVTVWHIGLESSTYALSNAGLILSVSDASHILAVSDEGSLARPNPYYNAGLSKYITVQLGPSYRYDATASVLPYSKAIEVEKSTELSPRPTKNLMLLSRAPATVSDNGHRILVDLGCETAGFLELELESEREQELLVTFGEHLDGEGRVPRRIGSRDFSIGYRAKKGSNIFLGAMRRIACRYLEIEYTSPARFDYVGLRPVAYPVTASPVTLASELHRRIYDICVYTLLCCMHEHYEDCPWREQALYALDSRNQMLCGYTAFSEYEYPRHNLILLGDGLHTDGLIKLTSPTDNHHPIPFFSLVYVMQVAEYVRHSGDTTVISELASVLDTVMSTFRSRVDETGLIPNFPAPAWNFYEWTTGNDGHGDVSVNDPDRYDLALNAMYVYVCRMYSELTGKTVDTSATLSGLKKLLYDSARGFFKNSNKDERISVIGNSLAILAGVDIPELAERLVRHRSELTDVSLSTLCFFYDALLASYTDAARYIVKDIEEKYSYMLSAGATTFWETIEGASAFGGAGSLCHGWSALPAYYLPLLDKMDIR